MSDYLGNLVSRALAASPAVRPALASPFETSPRDPVESLDPSLRPDRQRPAFPRDEPSPDRITTAARPSSSLSDRLAALQDLFARVEPPLPPVDGGVTQDVVTPLAPADHTTDARAPKSPAGSSSAPAPPRSELARATPDAAVQEPSSRQAAASALPRPVPGPARERTAQSATIAGVPIPAFRPIVPRITHAPPITSSALPATAQSAPSIHISIGRVEVRAIQHVNGGQKPAPAATRGPQLPLEEYLKHRNGGRP